MWWMVVLWGCGGGDCGPAECADICATAPDPVGSPKTPPAPSAEWSAFEKTLVTSAIEDARAGVRPFDAEGIGVCSVEGRKCVKYLGQSVETLPPGDFMLRAELRVPDIGEKGTWSVELTTECVTTKKTASGESSTTKSHSSTYGDLIYAGEDRGYRLQPLVKITSPYPYGSRDCKYKLTAPHPDGDKVYTGSWRVPGAEAE